MEIDQDSAQVRIPPPLIMAVYILAGWLLNVAAPTPIVPDDRLLRAGVFLIAAGVGTIIFSAFLFRSTRTAIKPWKTTSALIFRGPYKLSRNPIYLGMVLLMIGIADLINSLWIILMIVPFVVTINKIVIEKEEKYLEDKFGAPYLDYKKRVRRWI